MLNGVRRKYYRNFVSRFHKRLETEFIASSYLLPIEFQIIDLLTPQDCHHQVEEIKQIINDHNLNYHFTNWAPRSVETRQTKRTFLFSKCYDEGEWNQHQSFRKDAIDLWKSHKKKLIADDNNQSILTFKLMEKHPFIISTQVQRILDETLGYITNGQRYIHTTEWIPSFIKIRD